MSTPMGFRYLYDAGYIDREMDMWFNVSRSCCVHEWAYSSNQERNIYYVIQVEVFLSKAFQGGIMADEDEDMVYVSEKRCATC